MNREQRRASKSNGRKMMKGGWSPFEDWTDRANGLASPPRGLIRFWKNNIYTVQHFKKETGWGVIVTHRRRDGAEALVARVLTALGNVVWKS